MVKITGEFYLQTVEGDPELQTSTAGWKQKAPRSIPRRSRFWFDYLMRLAAQDFEDRIGIDRGARLKSGAVQARRGCCAGPMAACGGALNGVARELPLQAELRELAAPYYHSRLNGGEGDMLVGKALWAYHHKKAHMICELFALLVHAQHHERGRDGRGDRKVPGSAVRPLEIKGDAEVHALSRCQMILTEAKNARQKEFEGVLSRTGMTVDQLKALETPEMRRATYRVPRHGAVGTAANYALHLAPC